MAEDKKSDGIVKPIIIGVATTVLASMIVYHLGFEEKMGSARSPTNPSPNNNEELLQRQVELEAKLRQLNEKELERQQAELKEKLRQAELTKQWEDQNQKQRSSDSPDISGTWRDPNTGASYLISQNGDYFTFQEISWGVITAAGEGKITAYRANFSYMTVYNTAGTGSFTISSNGSHLTCLFTDMTTRIPMTLHLYR